MDEITRSDGILLDFNFHFAKVTDDSLFVPPHLVSRLSSSSYSSPLYPTVYRVPLSSSGLCISSISIGMLLRSLYQGASPPI